MVLQARERIDSSIPAVVAVAGVAGTRPVIVVATNAVREQGAKVGAPGVAAKVLGGGGGGKDDLAQGGGQDPQAVDAALKAVERELGA